MTPVAAPGCLSRELDVGQCDQRAGVVHSLPPIEDSFITAMSGDLTEMGISMALDQACVASKMAASLAVRPADAKEQLAEIMAFDSVRGVIADPSFWILVQSNDTSGAMDQLSFQRMVYDASLRQKLGEYKFANLPLISEPCTGDFSIENTSGIGFCKKCQNQQSSTSARESRSPPAALDSFMMMPGVWGRERNR